jgi:hypothetical protein
MQTINFQCGHCRNIMGVSAAFLGKQVRCPHCQQVVLAPTQAAAPVPAPVPAAAAPAPVRPAAGPAPGQAAQRDEHESIFGEQVDEDLFSSPPKSKVELPQQARPNANFQLEPTVFQVPGLPASGAPSRPGAGILSNSSPQVSTHPPTPVYMESIPPAPTEAEPGPQIQQPVLRRPDNTMLIAGLLLILIPYSILMTVIAIWMWVSKERTPHPLEMLPDLGKPPAKRVGGPNLEPLVVKSYQRTKADTPLPPHLITTLGKSLTVGDLEVTPLAVEQKRLLFKYRLSSYKPELSEHESLLLVLQLKNVSKNVEFRPTDLAYDHVWKDGEHPSATMPYTYLELQPSGKRYCSPLKWNATIQKQTPPFVGSDEYFEGQEEWNKILLPSEQMKTSIATDPKDIVPNALRNQKGNLLWRVQLRRGLVNWRDKDHSITCVIGVEFSPNDIQKK